jgi:hypothetical protein
MEVICPWAWIHNDGEILEKAYEKKDGKYDQLRRETSEAYPGKPVVQSTIVVSEAGAFMKRPQAEFAKVMKLEGRHLGRWGRNVVDAAIRW